MKREVRERYSKKRRKESREREVKKKRGILRRHREERHTKGAMEGHGGKMEEGGEGRERERENILRWDG